MHAHKHTSHVTPLLTLPSCVSLILIAALTLQIAIPLYKNQEIGKNKQN